MGEESQFYFEFSQELSTLKHCLKPKSHFDACLAAKFINESLLLGESAILFIVSEYVGRYVIEESTKPYQRS